MTLCSVSSVHLNVSQVPHDPTRSSLSNAIAALSAEDRESAGAYDDTLVAFATTFQLLTTETYPHIAYPAYEALGPWSQVYFISFWWGATAAGFVAVCSGGCAACQPSSQLP